MRFVLPRTLFALAGTSVVLLAAASASARQASSGGINPLDIDWPPLPPPGTPPTRTQPLFIYFEGPEVMTNDPLWALPNTRFQLVSDTRKNSSYNWAGNNFPGDNPADHSFFRPYAGPADYALQVVNHLRDAYAAANTWPASKPKLHAFELIGPNGQDSPWRDIDHPSDFIAYGGANYTLNLTNVSANAANQTISAAGLASFGPPAWAASTSYANNAEILGAQWKYVCIQAGISGSKAPAWGADEVADGSARWRRTDMGRVLISGFSQAANNGVYTIDRKPTPTSIALKLRFGPAGSPNALVSEPNRPSVVLHFAFGPSLWHAQGRTSGPSGSAAIATANFQAVKSALNAATPSALPADISRSFVHFVEDDESTPDMKPASVTSFLIGGQPNMPEWRTQGYWELNAADPRAGTVAVDGVYSVANLLDRAGAILTGGALVDPITNYSPWSPWQQTLRAWQWINVRAAHNIIAVNRFQPFKQAFGDVPCGNWNSGVISGHRTARVIIEPHGGEASQGFTIDNYAGAELWGISIPSMYDGVVGDYRGTAPLTDSPQWSTQVNWTDEAVAHGFPITTSPGSLARDYQIGEVSLREYAASVKRNYGYAHQVMPSFFLNNIVALPDPAERARIIARLSRALSKAYLDGLIDCVWAFAPDYKTNPQSRALWLSLSSQIARLTTKSADYDNSGVVDDADVTAYIALWFAHSPDADFNGDEVIDVDDLDAFNEAWAAQH